MADGDITINPPKRRKVYFSVLLAGQDSTESAATAAASQIVSDVVSPESLSDQPDYGRLDNDLLANHMTRLGRYISRNNLENGEHIVLWKLHQRFEKTRILVDTLSCVPSSVSHIIGNNEYLYRVQFNDQPPRSLELSISHDSRDKTLSQFINKWLHSTNYDDNLYDALAHILITTRSLRMTKLPTPHWVETCMEKELLLHSEVTESSTINVHQQQEAVQQSVLPAAAAQEATDPPLADVDRKANEAVEQSVISASGDHCVPAVSQPTDTHTKANIPADTQQQNAAQQTSLNRYEDNTSRQNIDSSSDSPKLIIPKFFEKLSWAFTHNMLDSAGRAGATALLDSTCRIAFGSNYDVLNMANVVSVGTSRNLIEAFPVELMESSCLPPNFPCWSASSAPQNFEIDNSYNSSSPPSSISEHPIKTKAHALLPHVLVTTTDHDGWAKYLLVCETIGGYSRLTDYRCAQISRKMIAACMHQSEVFGLILNARFAKLVRLIHNFQSRTYEYVENQWSHEYTFSSPTGQFNTRSLLSLFYHLVSILDYGKQNIHKVEIM